MKRNAHQFLIFLIVFFVLPGICFAHSNEVEMADIMRSNGKIYVVVAVVTVILTGIVIFLLRIDRKLRMLEKELKQK